MRISDWSSDVCSSDLPDDQRPIGLLRAAVRKALGEIGRGARGARDQQRAGSVLVEPVDEFGPHRRFIFQRIEQAIDMLLGLRDRKSVVKGKGVAVRVHRGGRRYIKKNKTQRIS